MYIYKSIYVYIKEFEQLNVKESHTARQCSIHQFRDIFAVSITIELLVTHYSTTGKLDFEIERATIW